MTIIRKITGLNWVANILFPIMVIFTELMWIYPWLTHIGRWPTFGQQRSPFSLISTIILLGLSFFITRLLIRRTWSLKWTRLSLIACGLAVILVILRIEFSEGFGILNGEWFVYTGRLLAGSFSSPTLISFAIPVALYLWWRGIRLGYSPLFFENIYTYFSIGMIAFVALILARGADPRNTTVSTIGIYVVGFFFFGLSALALAKLKGTQQKEKDERTGAIFNGRWLSIIIVVITGIVLVGIGFAGFFSTQSLSFLGQTFSIVSGVLFKGVYYVLGVVLNVVSVLLTISIVFVQLILNLLQGYTFSDALSSANLTGAAQEFKQTVEKTLPPDLTVVFIWIIVGIVLAAVVFLFIKTIMRFKPPTEKEDVDEINESLWSWEGFLGDIRLFINALWDRFRNKVKTAIPTVITRSSRTEREAAEGRLGIREIYQRLLRQASQFGITRRRQETPYEYTKRLIQSVPEGNAPLNELTNLYVDIRYGDLTAEANQIDYANSLWGTIRKMLIRQPE